MIQQYDPQKEVKISAGRADKKAQTAHEQINELRKRIEILEKQTIWDLIVKMFRRIKWLN